MKSTGHTSDLDPSSGSSYLERGTLLKSSRTKRVRGSDGDHGDGSNTMEAANGHEGSTLSVTGDEQKTDRQLEGTHTAERPLKFVHNPEPSGRFSVLDEHFDGTAHGVGSYQVGVRSDIVSPLAPPSFLSGPQRENELTDATRCSCVTQWTIASSLQTTIAITDISPTVTIFNYRTFIRQHHEIISPRDGKFFKPFYTVPILGEGQSVTGIRYPGPKAEALWRGSEAGGGGTDENIFLMQSKSRMPSDEYLRPSTPSL